MKDESKTEAHLIDELQTLRTKVDNLESLHKEEQQTRMMLKEAQRIGRMGHWELDLRSNSLYWSDEIYHIFELEPQEFEATYGAFLERVHPDDREFVDQAYADSVKNRTPYDIVHRLLLEDGTTKYVNEKCVTEYDAAGQPVLSIGTVQDITERKHAEEALKKASRAHKVLSDCNQMLVRATDETTLMNDLCWIIAHSGGYRLAWIGFTEHDKKKSVRPVAQFGFEEGYLETLEISWGRRVRGRGPTGSAIRTGKPVIARDISSDHNFEPLNRPQIIPQAIATWLSE